VDTCGYVPREIRESGAVVPGVNVYAFVSSLSAHIDTVRPHATEDDDVHRPPFPETEEVTGDTYGPLKVACEQEVRRLFGDRALVVRPGLIVGPHDPTDRFTWVRRVARGGEVLAPGPPSYPVQWIDARDLAGFILTMCEASTCGTFSAVTPAGAHTMGEVLEACRTASGSDAELTWVDREFLDEHGIEAWSDLPLWIPQLPGFNLCDPSRAIVAGLTTRDPAGETVADTLSWDRERVQTWPMDAGLAPEREHELLESWHLRNT
jgi:nucleoside-diphosphate-sugar epimerase